MNQPHPPLELMATDPQAREGLVEVLRREAELRAVVEVLEARLSAIEQFLTVLKANIGAKP
jgi:hypothetical protein